MNPSRFFQKAVSKSFRLLALCFGVVFLSHFTTAQLHALPAFPGAEGYGANATGGRGGDVYHVTNLNASGAGSFVEGISTVPSAGRTIVFDVSGYIRFPSGSGGTRMTASKVTIAGQTAPGDGVGFYNNAFLISGDDIIIRHIRFRLGKYGTHGDCIDMDSGSLNSILDHISMEFSTDENFSSYGSSPENVTMQYSVNSWGLETHSCGGLWDQNHATSHHNLWSHNHTRNPKARPNGLLEWINNVTFDWDIGFIMGDSQSNQNWQSNVINNYFIGPAGNTHSKALVKGTVADNGKPNFTVFLSGNLIDINGNGTLDGVDNSYSIVEGTAYAPGTSGLTPGALGYYQSGATIVGLPAPAVAVTTDSALLAYKKIVSNAGALRLDASYAGTIRDEVDTILFNKLTTQTAFHVTRESDTGASASGFGTLVSTAAPTDTDRDGMPDYYETALGWNPGTDDHTTALASSGGVLTGTTFFPANTPAGYTRLEEYLHFLAIPHGTVPKNISGTPTSLAVDLRKFTSGFSSSPVFTIANIVGGSVAQSGTGGYLATFTPTLNQTGRARFEFTVTDSQGSTWTQTLAVVVIANGLPRDLVWKGDGGTNAWDGSANNWLRSGSATAFSSGDYATFDDTGSKSPAVSVAGATANSMVVNAAGNYSFGGTGSITTNGPLIKRGTGSLTFLNASNSFASATVEAGSVVLGVGGGIGGGKFTLNDGAAFTNLYSASQPTVAMPFEVPAGNNATINTGNRIVLTGAVSGGGTLNYNVQTTVTRVDLKGPMAAFSGKLNFTNSGGVRLYFNGGSFNGFDGASVDLGGSVSLQPQTNSGGNTLNIAALSGASSAANLGGGSAGTVAYVIGNAGTDTSFAGTITGNATLTKTGGGRLTLGGSNSYTGATSVNAGWLVVDGALGSTPVTVANGAFLSGDGTIGGALTANAGATLSPGTAPFTGAAMTVNGGLTLNGNTIYCDISSSPTGANDKIVMNGGTLALNGTQYFQFLLLEGTIGAGTYDLITGATNSTVSSVSLTHNLPGDTRQTFALSRPPAGSNPSYVRLTVTGNTAALVWTGTNNGGTWDAQSTNWSGGPTATFFNGDTVTFNDTSATNTVNIGSAVAPRIVTVNNNTTSFTLSGTGSLIGSGSLTKTGSGVLTISNSGTSTLSGGTFINGGSIVLADSTANASGLGTGPITFNGGTLTMAGFNGSNSLAFAPMSNALIVPTGQTGTLQLTQRAPKPGAANVFPAIYGALSGGGTLNLVTKFIRGDVLGDWSAFTGVLNVVPGDGDGGDFRFGTSYSWPGMPAATVNLGANTAAYYVGTSASGAGTTIEIGELSGPSNSHLLGGVTGGRNFTYRIGGKTPIASEVTFAGTIGEQNAGTATSYVKTGAGTWTLAGSGAWNGGTSVEQGTLKITGAFACASAVNIQTGATLQFSGGSFASDALNIANGAFLTGNGAITGDLNNDGTLTCNSGTLTIDGNVVNNGTMRFTGGSGIVTTGSSNSFVNNGLLDLITGFQSLPANLQNNGVVVDASAVKLKQCSKAGSSFTVNLQSSYLGHNYQLQYRSSLSSGSWQTVNTKAGTGDPLAVPPIDGALVLSATNAPGNQGFYRVLVSP